MSETAKFQTEKKKIARAAARDDQNGEVIYLDAGTTDPEMTFPIGYHRP